MNDVQKNNLQENDSPGSMPADTTFPDPLTHMQTRLSSYVARRQHGLEDSIDPADPDGLARQVGQLASHIDQCLCLIRELSAYPPEMIEDTDNFLREGGLDAYPGFTDIDTMPYQSLFVSHDPTAPDSDSAGDSQADPPGGTQT